MRRFSSVLRIFTFFAVYPAEQVLGCTLKGCGLCLARTAPTSWQNNVKWILLHKWLTFWQPCVADDILYFCGNSINRKDSLCTRDALISDYCDVLLVVHCSALRVSGFISCDSEVVCTDVRTTFPPSLHCWHGGLRDSKARDARGHGVCIHTTAPLLQLSFCT